LVVQINDRLKGQLQAIAGQVLNLAVVTVTSLLDFLLTMILTFWLLQHGDSLWLSLMGYLMSSDSLFGNPTPSFQNFFIVQLIYGTCIACTLIPTFVAESAIWLAVWLNYWDYGSSTLWRHGWHRDHYSLVALQDVWLGFRVLIAAVLVQQVLENLVAPNFREFTGFKPSLDFDFCSNGARLVGCWV